MSVEHMTEEEQLMSTQEEFSQLLALYQDRRSVETEEEQLRNTQLMSTAEPNTGDG